MNLHEYQAKELLKRYNVPTQEGIAVDNVDAALNAYRQIPGRQRTPLEPKRGRAFTATTARPACSTAPASSLDNAANSFSMLPG